MSSGKKKKERAVCGRYINENIKKSKGIKKCVVSRKIQFNDFVDCIQKNCEIKSRQNTIRSLKHILYSISQEKVALSPFDDKRYIIKSNNTETLAWGHFKIDIYENRMDQ